MIEAQPGSTRYLSLDALRGVAVMGILLMNIIAFAMPTPAYVNPLAWGGTGIADLSIWAANFVLVDGKMRGLFSLLFGASMLLVIDRATARGENAVSVHFRRLGWLLVFGLAHYYLVWVGDILFQYAVIGMVAFLFRNRSADSLVKWSIAVLLVNLMIWILMAAAMLQFQQTALQPDASAETLAQYREMIGTLGAPGSSIIAQELAFYTGGYSGILAFRTSGEQLTTPFISLHIMGLETLGYMLLGMALLRMGFMTGAWDGEDYRRFAVRAYMIGLPPMIALAAWCWLSDFDPVLTFSAQFAWAAPFRIALILAHAALALWLIKRHAGTALVARIAATGRVAFTNYLGTSLLMTTIFYGYGLGLFGQVSRAGVYLFVLAAWAIMLLWSKPWLERFSQGPFEWLWRALARGMRPTAIAPA